MNIGTLVVVAVAAAAVGGCATTRLFPDRDVAHATAAPLAAGRLSPAEGRYITAVRDNTTYLRGFSDGTLVELGHGICSALTSTGGVTGIYSSGVPRQELKVLVGAAVVALCPAHKNLITDYVKGDPA